MKPFRALALLLIIPAQTAPLLFAEQVVESRIDSVGLFKNGLAVVTRIVEVPGPGTYVLEEAPNPIHGTFWVESNAKVKTRSTRREVEVDPVSDGSLDLQDTLAGQEVIVYFKGEGGHTTRGTVVDMPDPESADFGRRTDSFPTPYSSFYTPAPANRTPRKNMLVLRREDSGRSVFIDPAAIAYIETLGKVGKARRLKPVLAFEVGEGAGENTKILVSYLARGLSWAPSYRVDMSGENKLAITQKAVIRNELIPLDEAKVYLISGFPSVQFAHVTSPIAARVTWSSFFQSLNRRPGRAHDLSSNVISQQAVMFNEPSGMGDQAANAPSVDEGVDVHYQSAGHLSLALGDALAFDVASAHAACEHIVEWIVPDNRKVNGRFISDYERQNNPDKYQDSAWDAVRFHNPFDFPMTTAPAMVITNGRFNGQRTCYWTAPGEKVTLHINKALSLLTRCTEQEMKDKDRRVVYIGGNDFREVQVTGELLVRNLRTRVVPLVIRRRFSGELSSADGDPKLTLLEEGVYSVNRRNELLWELPIEPGEEVRLTYKYSVLVDA